MVNIIIKTRYIRKWSCRADVDNNYWSICNVIQIPLRKTAPSKILKWHNCDHT